VPYAFSKPQLEPPDKLAATIYYTGEVDISADCFARVADDPLDAQTLSASAWDAADSVVSGRVSLRSLGQTLKVQHGEARQDVYRTTIWSVRNRARFLLLQAIAKAFPGRVVLRGSDWRRLGFEARPTRFWRGHRMAQYRRHRVSLDLGSKSTEELLYPRSADIMAAGGGIAMFDTGISGGPWSTTLETRRGSSIEGLVTIVDRLLSMGEKELAAENRRIQEDYADKRLKAGAALGAQICTAS
jgi:hypothetical protein